MNPRPQTAEQRLSRYRELAEEARRCADRATSDGSVPLAVAWKEFADEISRIIAAEEARR
jgi:hypothetical protein